MTLFCPILVCRFSNPFQSVISAKKKSYVKMRIQTATAKGEYAELNTRMHIDVLPWHTARRSALSAAPGWSSGEVLLVPLPSETGSRTGEGVLESLRPPCDTLAGGLQKVRMSRYVCSRFECACGSTYACSRQIQRVISACGHSLGH